MNAVESRPEPDVQVVHGYCVHCRSQRTMQGAIQVCNKRGGRDLKGQCATCGKPMYRLGGWDSLARAAVVNEPLHEVPTDTTPLAP